MPMSPYLRNLRAKVGHDLLILPSVTIIVYDEQGHILLVRHGDTGVWVAPGGAIEPGERPAETAIREMEEETGLIIRPIRILGVYGGPEFQVKYTNGDQVTYVMTVYEGEVVGGALRAGEDEILELRYFSREELEEVKLASWARVVLPEMFERR
ncbi:MAG TPA: NUDIX domain-containing protein [Anaerolineales bacterium]|nr:NUDIX domain-containing protein [Anaerolineales bacterium]